MKAGQPRLEAAVVGVHVLYVNGAIGAGAHPLAGLKIDRLVRDTVVAGERPLGGIGVGHQPAGSVS